MNKPDANCKKIMAYLRAAGATVEQITSACGRPGIPDLLVGFRGTNYLLEVKVLKGKRNPKPAALSENQIAWHAWWAGQAIVVSTEWDALRCLGIEILNADQAKLLPEDL